MLSDEQAIKNLLFAYMDATDAGDFATRAALFADIIAQQQAQSIRINMIAAQAQRLVDSVALYQALGGGVS